MATKEELIEELERRNNKTTTAKELDVEINEGQDTTDADSSEKAEPVALAEPV